LDAQTLLIVSTVAPIAVSLAGVLFKFLVGLLPQDKQYEIENQIGNVVRAVEQSMPGATPEAKKAKAIELANAVLKASKLPIDPQVIDVLIEEAVFHLPATDSAAAGVPVGA
jgi:hypothetical protein